MKDKELIPIKEVYEYMDNDEWIVEFQEHKPLSFKNKADLIDYLNGRYSKEHGFMEYKRVPHSIEHREYFTLDCYKDNFLNKLYDVTLNMNKDKQSIDLDGVKFNLLQLGAYFSIQIRDKKEPINVHIELYQAVKNISEFISQYGK